MKTDKGVEIKKDAYGLTLLIRRYKNGQLFGLDVDMEILKLINEAIEEYFIKEDK